MSGIHGLEHVQRLAASYLADHDPVGAHSEAVDYEVANGHFALAFDVGTTFSGVSYAILEPNEIPKIHGVTRCVSLLPHPRI